jgi:hypothetical protein
MVCCFDAFDPIPDEPETQRKDPLKQTGETAAPIETLVESKTAEESESDNNEVGEDTDDDDELEENEDLEEILVSGKQPTSKTFKLLAERPSRYH